MKFPKIKKSQFLKGFLACTLVLALVRCIHPSIAEPSSNRSEDSTATSDVSEREDSVAEVIASQPQMKFTRADSLQIVGKPLLTSFYTADGKEARHRIYSVPNYGKAFPDLNDVQLQQAQRWGVAPAESRQDVQQHKDKLVYVGSNPYFYVDRLRNSMPYLVPRAAVLLQDIGRNFMDSLQIKGIPLHKVIVTSVMRTEEDMTSLRGRNSNAAQNSCHTYGTTFDMCYNRYVTVEDPQGPKRWKVRNDTLKYVLSEVLDDMRQQGRCLIKYEVKQGCFHITVR